MEDVFVMKISGFCSGLSYSEFIKFYIKGAGIKIHSAFSILYPFPKN